jgi:lipoprotein NlpI
MANGNWTMEIEKLMASYRAAGQGSQTIVHFSSFNFYCSSGLTMCQRFHFQRAATINPDDPHET